ncbi:hypothetical protein MG293_000811 [Ovis ammon polii]|uniref:Uncharacterized protein n=1 Tax=Ovis ammon polii TaxID=230172 RepID=A0AAD4ULY5_OVIAM|nr:hypothetical protein MG293_000811 [Ovis ammon polii]
MQSPSTRSYADEFPMFREISQHTQSAMGMVSKSKEKRHIVDLASLVARTVESVCNAGDLSSIFGLGRSSGERNGYPVQDFFLENSMDRGAWDESKLLKLQTCVLTSLAPENGANAKAGKAASYCKTL